MSTKVLPCVRYVLVRNVQFEKSQKHPGDISALSEPTTSVLTEEGVKMAEALGSLIDYLDARPYCVSDDKVLKQNYTIIVDGKAEQHFDTSKPLREKHRGINTIYTNDVNDHFRQFEFVSPDHINICILFTDAATIQEICQGYVSEKLYLGSALGSTTIFDMFPDNRIFVHEFGGLGALQYGGYDTSKIYWGNNGR